MRLRTIAVLAIAVLGWWRYRSAWHGDDRRAAPQAGASMDMFDAGAIIRPKRNVDPQMIARADPGIDPGIAVVPQPRQPKVRRSRS